MRLIMQVIAGGKKWNVEIEIQDYTEEQFLEAIKKNGAFMEFEGHVIELYIDEAGVARGKLREDLV